MATANDSKTAKTTDGKSETKVKVESKQSKRVGPPPQDPNETLDIRFVPGKKK